MFTSASQRLTASFKVLYLQIFNGIRRVGYRSGTLLFTINSVTEIVFPHLNYLKKIYPRNIGVTVIKFCKTGNLAIT